MELKAQWCVVNMISLTLLNLLCCKCVAGWLIGAYISCWIVVCIETIMSTTYAQHGGEQTHALYMLHTWLIASCKA